MPPFLFIEIKFRFSSFVDIKPILDVYAVNEPPSQQALLHKLVYAVDPIHFL